VFDGFAGTIQPKEERSIFRSISQLVGRNEEFLNKASPYLNTRSGRPGISSYDYSPAYTNRMWLSWCYWYEDEVTIFSDVIQKMRDEVTRYGFKWNPAFAKKCNVCGEEYQDDVDDCELCHSTNLREPNKSQLRATRVDKFNTIIERANLNKQSMQEVIKAGLFHALVTDNGYILAHKEYMWGADGTLRSFPREYFALDPRDVIKLFDFETGYPGKGRVCLDHRSSLLGEKDTICPVCQKPTFRAAYQVFTATKTSTYYTDDEICQLIYFYPSIIYGTPKCFKIKDQLISYHMIEKRVRNFYEFCKVPGILFIPTDDVDALHEMWQKTRDQTKDDPFTPAVLGVSEHAPSTANFIRLMQDPNAELIGIKDELRQRIASAMGVTLAFTNDSGMSSGQKNDKNAAAMADRTIRTIQQTVDKKWLRWIANSMGITDWKLECEPNINENKLEKEEIRAAELNNMERYNANGLKVIFKGEGYTVKKGPLMSPEMMMGMMGGGMPMGGAMGGMPPMPPMGGAPPGMPLAGPEGVPMTQDNMGNPMPSLEGQPLDIMDQMAEGNAQAEPEPEIAPDADAKYQSAMDNLKTLIGTKKEKPKKIKVNTKLSSIIDDMFLSSEEREAKAKEKREQEEAEEAGPGMPPMGGPMGGQAPMPPLPGAPSTPPEPPVPPGPPF
jgi:hypothetical protein